MIRAAVVGYGNIGRAVAEAIGAASDFEFAGIVSRSSKESEIDGVQIVRKIGDLQGVDVAILCGPSKAVPEVAEEILLKGIATVDCFDVHGDIYDLLQRLDVAAKEGGVPCVTSVGFDPGLDSAIRGLFEAAAPKGITYTNFGPGMSMGHTVAVKGVAGVKDALSMTIPLGAGVHRRMVYVELEEGANFKTVSANIKLNSYFINDETVVTQVSDVKQLIDVGHGTSITRKGVSGVTHNQRFEFEMRIDNPAMTAQMMVSSARAVLKQPPGAYTVLHLPIIDMLEGPQEDLIRRLV